MEDGISILVKPVPAKHPCAISVTAAGIFILAMPEQPEKQYSPKRVTPEGISILVKLRQFEKVYCDIVLTADGILTLFICSQSAKQYCPILLIVDGSVTLVTVLQFWKQRSSIPVTLYDLPSLAFTLLGTTISPVYFQVLLDVNMASSFRSWYLYSSIISYFWAKELHVPKISARMARTRLTNKVFLPPLETVCAWGETVRKL